MHEAVLRMLREEPRLLRLLLRGKLDLPPESVTTVEVTDATVSPATSNVTRAVDLALVLRSDRQKLVILVEVQLAPDRTKARSWPVYVAHYAAMYDAPCVLVVVTFDEVVVRWARRIAKAALGVELRPALIGPDAIPRVDSLETAKADIDLALLSLFAHLGEPEKSALPVADAFFAALAGVDRSRRAYYADVALKTVRSKAPRLGELIMQPPPGYQVQDEFLRKLLAQGELAGEARLLTRLLERRFGPIEAATRARVDAADATTLERWADRLLSASSIDDVFDAPS